MSGLLIQSGWVIVIARTWRRSTARDIADRLNALVAPTTPYRIQRERLRWAVVIDHGRPPRCAAPKGVTP